MTVPPRRHVTQTRAERALPLPAPLNAVAELLDTVRGELLADRRPESDAELRIDGTALVVSYLLPGNKVDEPRARVVGFQ
ncbi:hypothetical protein AB8O64_19845 [Streptomyces sp. QH1-20]|uniref:hypothetical protein n=1 Tax=Streptomyces sp. QH1-20 TaxID=3240934 RepID=UPI003514835E